MQPRSRRATVLSSLAVLLAVAAVTLVRVPVAAAGSGVIWLTAETESEKDHAHVRVPLEWLAAVDRGKQSKITIDKETIDCVGLWEAYRDLPVGESREVRRGAEQDGERYVLHVRSERPSHERAQGKLHILARDKDGKTTDVRFPLDLGSMLQNLGNVIATFLGVQATISDRGKHAIEGFSDFARLADYGPFTAIEEEATDGSRVRILVE